MLHQRVHGNLPVGCHPSAKCGETSRRAAQRQKTSTRNQGGGANLDVGRTCGGGCSSLALASS
eukprot:608044-Amphidinium_carterae.1